MWGDTKNASPVEVVVEQTSNGQTKPRANFERDQKEQGKHKSMPKWDTHFQPVSYALFPFQGQLSRGKQNTEVPPAKCMENVRFTLTIRWRRDKVDWEKDLAPAVKAWANFGGVGSRTRRGCGAVFVKELAASNESELAALVKLTGPQSATQWPLVSGGRLVIDTQANQPMQAWERAVRLMCDFRQGEGVGRNTGQNHNRPGRSHWPEPESIRRATNTRSLEHGRIPDDAFPRAEFGLPIVFHFKDRDDPPDTTLYPAGEGRERMASPLILRPVKLRDGKCFSMILLMRTTPLNAVELCEGAKNHPLGQPFNADAIRGERLAKYPKSPMHGRSPNGSAVEAFLTFAVEEGFKEVRP